MSHGSSEEAEDAFYAAFSVADTEAMMRVWAASATIVCIHPGGPRLEGLTEIRRSWELILRDRLPRRFVLRGRRIFGTGDQRIHLLEENITVPVTHYVAPPVLATNVYQRVHGSWFLVLHHGSVAPATVPERAPQGAEQASPTILH